MQAICGFFRLDGKPADAAELARLRAALVFNPHAHQGRFDGCGEGNVALGAAAWGGRSAGGDDSPVARHAETGCVAVADTRLDDCKALAKRLDLRVDRSPTQAELILHAWLRWGDQCADVLRGDFAFAIWDPRERRLFCARDIMGVRPLYVHHQPGKLFAFASRAQALLALSDVPRDLDEGRIADVLVTHLEGIDKTSTFYTAIKRLPPAYSAEVTAARFEVRRYWQLEPGRVALPRGDQGWADALTGVLERAIARHLDGAARVGSMVSGGMDSSSLAVIAADQLAAAGKGPLPTFSSLDSAAGDAETRAVLEMARASGFQPNLIESANVVADRDAFAAMAWDSDEPFDTAMLLVHAQYRAAAHTGVDAVIDGGDADVLFSGGNTMARQLRYLHWLGFWQNFRGFHLAFPGYPVASHLNSLARTAFVPQRVRKLRRLLSGERRDRHGCETEVAHSLIAPEFARRVDLTQRLARLASWSPSVAVGDVAGEVRSRLDHSYTTCGAERYHRVAAWHGVDPRHPFMDRDVLELCVNLPDRQRLRDGWMKACLREAMRGRLPEPVRIRRDKWHLGGALCEHILVPEEAAARASLARQRGILQPYVDMAQLERAFSGWRDTGATPGKQDVLMALSLGSWLDRFAKSHPTPQRGKLAVDSEGRVHEE